MKGCIHILGSARSPCCCNVTVMLNIQKRRRRAVFSVSEFLARPSCECWSPSYCSRKCSSGCTGWGRRSVLIGLAAPSSHTTRSFLNALAALKHFKGRKEETTPAKTGSVRCGKGAGLASSQGSHPRALGPKLGTAALKESQEDRSWRSEGL
eukprot:458237-Pelagomonas_calceolata.AAC.2